MSRTPASITQADVARAIRAAKQAGAVAVSLLLPGGARFRFELEPSGENIPNSVEGDTEIVL
jgi:hypothetical protein